MRFFSLTFLLVALFWGSCSYETADEEQAPNLEVDSIPKIDSTSTSFEEKPPEPPKSDLEISLIKAGMVDAQTKLPEAVADLKYATADNFIGRNVYGDFDRCYLRPEVVNMLVLAQKHLIQEHPRLRFIFFDCLRPHRVQKQMWEVVKGTSQQSYVASPAGTGSIHNYGAAVDLGLIHLDTGLVDMGTPFDFFGPLAQPRFEARFLQEGKLSQTQVSNRLILRESMQKAGFRIINNEWWHFNAFAPAEVRRRYDRVN